VHVRRSGSGGSRAADLPVGTVTFLFTDIEGSTRAWSRDARAMASASVRHDKLIEQAVVEHGGRLVRPRGEGDSRFAVFARASDAVSAAVAAQRALVKETWSSAEPLRVRMAVHTGEADLRLGDYYGPAVNHCGNLRAVAHGGQVLVSALTAELVRESLSPDVGLRDVGLHQLKGSDVAERVWQAVHPDLPADFPPLLAVAGPPGNLPHQLSSFIGRDQAIHELADLVSRIRLVTLTGPGGIGKTRLALAVAHETQHMFTEGVWLVRLESLAEGNLVPGAVGSVLGVAEQASPRLLDTVGRAIGSKHMLLLLDNCEHLIESCAEVADKLLQSCSSLHILATSREPLGIPGEAMRRIPPLRLSSARSDLPGEQAGEVESVRLFVERAQATQPLFELTERNVRAVTEICARLDGLPLAIELAAAHINTLGEEQIKQYLDDSFRLLTGGGRTKMPRQQTLRATIDWSYDLLSAPERALFRRLGVFRGGWARDAAQAVCNADEDLATDDVLNLLHSLVGKSLLMVEDHFGDRRYRSLDTIRRYAVELLDTSSEADAIRRRHAEYYVALAERAEPALTGPDQLRWFRRLEAEQDNVRVALELLLEQEDIGPALGLASALWYFWYVRGHLREGRRWLDRILARDGATTAARGRALNGAGYLALALGESQRAMALHEEALALFQSNGDAHGVALSLRCVGRAALAVRDLPRASRILERALEMLRPLGDAWAIATCVNNLGNLAWTKRDYTKARDLWTEALQLRQECGDVLGIASSLSSLGMVAVHLGDTERGARLIQQALVLQRDLDNTSELADSLGHLANAARINGQFEHAAELLEEALLLRGRLASSRGIAVALVDLADVSLQQGAHAKTGRLLLQALAVHTEPEPSAVVAAVFEGIASLCVAEGKASEAARLLGAADAIRDQIGVPRPRLRDEVYARTLGAVRVLLGDAVLASELAEGSALAPQLAIAQAKEMLQSFRLEE
jgi:predicted ATPase/class 3 adenylate cyclase